MKSIKNILLISVATLAIGACDPGLEAPINAGSELNVSKYVAFGNSITAGFADGGLYNEGIEASYPNLIARQLQRVGGGPFLQPLFNEGQENGSGYLIITGYDATGSPIQASTTTPALTGTKLPGGGNQLTRYEGENNNYGIPGIAIANLNDPTYALGNPFLERLAGEQPISYNDWAGNAGATFFTAWLGNNDVLGYVSSGGATPITPTSLFTTNLKAFLDKVTANGAKGAIANIPPITAIPYVTNPNSIIASRNARNFPQISFPLSTGATAAQINGLYQTTDPDGTGPALRYSSPGFTDGPNNFFAIVDDDPATTDIVEVRQMNPAKDFLLLPILQRAAELQTGLGVVVVENMAPKPNPIPTGLVLSEKELIAAITAQITFNTILKQEAEARGLALVDIDALFKLATETDGISGVVDGFPTNASYIQGNLFSLDGVHPTPFAHALVANEFIRSINAKYNAAIPLVDIRVLNPRAVLFP